MNGHWVSWCRHPAVNTPVSSFRRHRVGIGRSVRKARLKLVSEGYRHQEYVYHEGDVRQADEDILHIAIPTVATLASEPIASLVSTAFVGQLGASQLAGVGVSLSVYNTFVKLFSMPLLAIITSTIAVAVGETASDQDSGGSDKVGQAAMSSIALSLIIGLIQCFVLVCLGRLGLQAYGTNPGSDMYEYAESYLNVRTIGNVTTVLFVSLLGIFRGLGDAVAPLWATLCCTGLNVFFEFLFLFEFGWAVGGAAAAVVTAQSIGCLFLAFLLTKKVPGLKLKDLKIAKGAKVLGNTGLLMIRTLCISSTYACGTALIARTGSVYTAAHQIAFQIWLASSLLADSLAVAAQSLIARSIGSSTVDGRHYSLIIVRRVLLMGTLLGSLLTLGLAIFMLLCGFEMFTSDTAVIEELYRIFPMVVLSQIVNSIAFVLDGIMYSMNAYAFAAKAMVMSCAPAIGIMTSSSLFPRGSDPHVVIWSVWCGLLALMVGRTLTILVPLLRKQGPFVALQEYDQ